MVKNVLRRIGTAGFPFPARATLPFSEEESEALHGHLPLQENRREHLATTLGAVLN